MNVPIKKPSPNITEFIQHLLGQKTLCRTPLVEYIVDDVVMGTISRDILGRSPVPFGGKTREEQSAYWDYFLNFWYCMGYDFVRLELSLPFESEYLYSQEVYKTREIDRGWKNSEKGPISSWEDFERYAWPKIEEFDFFPFEYIASQMPEGMGMLVSHSGGIFEQVSSLFSYTGLAYALHGQPDLVEDVCWRVGKAMENFYSHLLQIEGVAAVFPGDDMGFRTATLISPEQLKKFFLPWHKRFARMAHEKNIPYFLHSCGQLEEIYDYLIEEVKIDGKHSFEDAITPVDEFKQKYGKRIAVLGGIDVDILAGGSTDEVRKKVRQTIERCSPGGRFAIGSGSSIPSYVSVENYLAMLDEVLL